MEFKKYQVHSNAYSVDGIITDCHWSMELSFPYDNKTVSIAIERPFPFSEEALVEHGRQVMETYIDKMVSEGIKKQRLILFQKPFLCLIILSLCPAQAIKKSITHELTPPSLCEACPSPDNTLLRPIYILFPSLLPAVLTCAASKCK